MRRVISQYVLVLANFIQDMVWIQDGAMIVISSTFLDKVRQKPRAEQTTTMMVII